MTGYTTFTALYDQRDEAERVQAELETLGVIDTDGRSLFGGDAYREQGLGDAHWVDHKGAVPPDADRRIYQEGVKRGGYLLTVNIDADYADRVHHLLEGSKAVDLAEREQQYKTEGLLPEAIGVGALAAGTAATEPAAHLADADASIPIVEERLRVGKREVERGGVRVRSYVVETPVHETVALREEHVTLERRPVGQPLAAADADAFREREILGLERAEEAVVAKDARVTEEIALRKDAGQRVQTVEDTVRRTEVEVDRLPPRGGSPA